VILGSSAPALGDVKRNKISLDSLRGEVFRDDLQRDIVVAPQVSVNKLHESLTVVEEEATAAEGNLVK